jgi:lactate dehydrogenase-like 2-hydroxyacid dehydrogenase
MSMRKPVLVVTTLFMSEIEARIDRDYDARRNPHERPFTRDELIAASSGADALFITPLDRLDADFFKRAPASVKVIATYSVGTDHIDLHAAANRKIAIAYTPGINADATAEIAMLLMLGASRRAYEGQEMVRTGTWNSSSQMLLGWQLTGKVLGILGMGQVGRAVAQRARGFRNDYPLFQSDPLARGVRERRGISLQRVRLTSSEPVSYPACA